MNEHKYQVTPIRRKLEPSVKQQPQHENKVKYPTIMAGLYDLEHTLGKGHFAVVKAAKHVFTGEKVAVKVIDKTKLDAVSQKALLKEVLCMKLVQHPNVVKLYEVIDTSTKMYLVLELGQGDLYDLILKQQGGLPEETSRVYFTQILTGVSYCHRLHVAHRDLKPENVVYFPSSNDQIGQVKLTDFGFSNNFCPGVNLDTSCGSLAYSAPEILLGDSYDAPAIDIWSLGVILYMLVCGRAPFQEANDSETLIMIMDVKYTIPHHISPLVRDLINRMLVRDPAKRITLDQIENHAWIQLSHKKHFPLISTNTLTDIEKDFVFNEMVKGGIVASYDEVVASLRKNAYNHVTSTYYLLAERYLRDKSCGVLRKDRKNSHQFEDVVLPSTKEDEPVVVSKSKSLSQKFVLIEEEDKKEEEVSGGSPHHPHYYHHIRVSRDKDVSAVEAAGSSSPPLHHRRAKLNKSHYNQHSDSSDEGGACGCTNNTVVPNIVVNATEKPAEEEESNNQQQQETSQPHDELVVVSSIKPSPSYDNSVSESSSGKKKRVLFLSWFFKKTSKIKQQRANGIYKTRSCAELKTRSTEQSELNTRDTFAINTDN